MEVITNNKDLSDFCQALSDKPFIAVDTEFMREKTYWPILCLVQVAADGVEGMIDPLADNINLDPLLDLLANPDIVKVFHAARQDLEIFHKLMGKVPAPLFDSQIAAMACGFGDQIGYESLMRQLLNANIDKGSRFTDWSRRPLSDAQLTYALSDVTHLREAYPLLRDRLDKENRNHWVEEEMMILADPEIYFVEPTRAWKRLKLRNTRPQELGPLVKLAEWREREAQKRDIPRNRVIKDDGLFEVARMRPKDAKAMSQARSIPKGFERSETGQSMLVAVHEGMAIPKKELPQIDSGKKQLPPPPDVLDLLRVLLKTQCETYDVAPKLIANAADIEALARSDNAPIPALKGWRREIFGEMALKLKHGEVALKLQNNRVKIIEES